MRRFLGLIGTSVAMAVILLQRSSVCWAAETTVEGVSSTLYGGAGTLTAPNNEQGDDVYDVTRAGVGLLGILRPNAANTRGTPGEPSGYFIALGGSFELENALHSACGIECNHPSNAGGRYLAKHFAGRLGFGYSFPIFEFRTGALAAFPDPNVDYAMTLVMPDVMARVGRRDMGWFELGLGAYSASTNLRPGFYLGGAPGAERLVQFSAHTGLHFVNGLCCATVTQAGYAGELSLAHSFSSSLTASVSAALFAAERSSGDAFVAEGSAKLAFAL
jgi:hypothetical protein